MLIEAQKNTSRVWEAKHVLNETNTFEANSVREMFLNIEIRGGFVNLEKGRAH